jgi:5-oxoprolinase (ATP-hydrolysing)
LLKDRGGTFTDVWASIPGQDDVVLKLLSVDPSNYDDAPAEGIRRVLERVSGKAIPRHSPIPKDLIRSIRMGTTVATNGKIGTIDRPGTNLLTYAQLSSSVRELDTHLS